MKKSTYLLLAISLSAFSGGAIIAQTFIGLPFRRWDLLVSVPLAIFFYFKAQ